MGKKKGGGRGGRGGGESGAAGAGAAAAPGGPRFGAVPIMPEGFKIDIAARLEEFRQNDEPEMAFPPTLDNTERRFVHTLCKKLGLVSKSRGKGESRFLTVRKQKSTTASADSHVLRLQPATRALLADKYRDSPVRADERALLEEEMPDARHARQAVPQGSSPSKKRGASSWPSGPPQPARPRQRIPGDLAAFRQTLPAMRQREEVLEAVRSSQVILLSGETGCGKTTQVPQFILEDAHNRNEPCRIICTQPRRISAITVAERVATEWGEGIGQTVGFNVRLESKSSAATQLLFCTTGTVLRMMASNKTLAGVTHLVLDEVHERDRFSDFLLILVREMLPLRPDLKIVLMSAALHADLFIEYFGHCPRIHIPGFTYPVTEFYLEDVLRKTGYTSMVPAEAIAAAAAAASESEGSEPTDPSLFEEFDEAVEGAFLAPHDESAQHFFHLQHLILDENVSANRRHPKTGMTPLMAAAARGSLPLVNFLLRNNADKSIKLVNGCTAEDLARKYNRTEVADVLASWGRGGAAAHHNVLSPADKAALDRYQRSFDDDMVDLNLIQRLLECIAEESQSGAVLIFLPGYDEIIRLRQMLERHAVFGNAQRFTVLPLHSACSSSEQRLVFRSAMPGCRKIILSTNIAETSVTINDVVYVIDSGKMKEKAYDSLTSVSTLQTIWVSQASALQRRGRAGRCQDGVCFHLFSRRRHENMADFQQPELLRTQLEELCLQAKLLSVDMGCGIEEFLCKAPESPPQRSIHNAISLLKRIDALDEDENVTALGHYLAILSIEPQLAKMLLLATSLGCLDPVLTIACVMTYRDPFVLPMNPNVKNEATAARRRFSGGVASDHLAVLTAFKQWEAASARQHNTYSWCDRNFLSQATLNMIHGMRQQLLSQLRTIGFLRVEGGGNPQQHDAPSWEEANRNSSNWTAVQAALCAGLYPQIARANSLGNSFSTNAEQRAKIHTSSVIGWRDEREIAGKWLVFSEINRTSGRTMLHQCSEVSPLCVLIFGARLNYPMVSAEEAEDEAGAEQEDGEEEDEEGDEEGAGKAKKVLVAGDEWVAMYTDPDDVPLLEYMRQRWQAMFLSRIKSSFSQPEARDWETVDMLLQALASEMQGRRQQAVDIAPPAQGAFRGRGRGGGRGGGHGGHHGGRGAQSGGGRGGGGRGGGGRGGGGRGGGGQGGGGQGRGGRGGGRGRGGRGGGEGGQPRGGHPKYARHA